MILTVTEVTPPALLTMQKVSTRNVKKNYIACFLYLFMMLCKEPKKLHQALHT